jgi:hypothetical protein
MHSSHHARTMPLVWSGAGQRIVLAHCQEAQSYWRHEWYRGVAEGSQRGTVSLKKIHTDMVEPREAALRGTAADLSREGLDTVKDTHTHRQAPSVAAMTRTSLRLVPLLSSRTHPAAGVPRPRKGAG